MSGIHSNSSSVVKVDGYVAIEEPLGVNVTNTAPAPIPISISPYTANIDAFGRLRVSEPYTIFDSKILYDESSIFWDIETNGTGDWVYVQGEAAVDLSVGASNGDYAIRQTKMRFNYQAGKSQLILLTGSNFHPEEDVSKMWGYYNSWILAPYEPYNGIYFQSDGYLSGGEISFNIVKNGIIRARATQDEWNLDKMDGTGASGITLDFGASQIFVIIFEWLGVGSVYGGIVNNGIIYPIHRFDNANQLPDVYMADPNCSIRYEIRSRGGSGLIRTICSSVASEGGITKTGYKRSISTAGVHLDANSIDTPYISIAIRLKTTHLSETIRLDNVSVFAESADNFRFFVTFNPTFNGTLSWVDLPNSGVQYALGATANDITNMGVVIYEGWASQQTSVSANLDSFLRLGAKINGTRDILVLGVAPLGVNADIQASMNWNEE